MICHRNKLIFVHLPKCAGTSIEVGFTGESWSQGQYLHEQHLTAAEARDAYGGAVFDSYFKFTIVRNPWDLLIAYYLWGCWGLRGHADTSLKGRLRRFFGRSKAWGHPFRADKSGFGTQPTLTEYLDDSERFNKALQFSASGSDLSQQRAAISIEGEIAVDYVGKFENLQDDINTICNKAGTSAVELPHRLKSNRTQHYSQYYSDEAREIVRDKYSSDIETFQYEFEDRRGTRW